MAWFLPGLMNFLQIHYTMAETPSLCFWRNLLMFCDAEVIEKDLRIESYKPFSPFVFIQDTSVNKKTVRILTKSGQEFILLNLSLRLFP